MMNRLQQQLNFLYEIDKLKTILRRSNLIADTSRLENTAEHSWHLGLYAIILAEYSNVKIDISRVIKLVLLHDIVEIDAGDTFCYDDNHNESKQERELRAADRIFGLLPDDQRDEFMNLWKEFEERKIATIAT
jgi:putative hydrolases of HD superfamily